MSHKAWVVEAATGKHWWTGNTYRYSGLVADAVRFLRRSDAQRVIDGSLIPRLLIAVEYEFTDTAVAPDALMEAYEAHQRMLAASRPVPPAPIGVPRLYYRVEHDEDKKGGFHLVTAEGLDLADFGVLFREPNFTVHGRPSHYTQAQLKEHGIFDSIERAVAVRRDILESMRDSAQLEVTKQENRLAQLDYLLTAARQSLDTAVSPP